MAADIIQKEHEHKWENKGLVEYGEYYGFPNKYLLQCNLCKEVKLASKPE